MSIRYALVRHRHNNGQLSDDRVYIPVNVPMYAGCYYGYDLTEPAGVQVSAPTGWQRDSAVVRFSGGTDTGTSLPDWSAAPGDYGSGIHHYEYQINGGAWTGCPVGDPTVTITAGGETTVTARVVTERATPPARQPRQRCTSTLPRPMCRVSRFPRNSGRILLSQPQ